MRREKTFGMNALGVDTRPLWPENDRYPRLCSPIRQGKPQAGVLIV